MVEVKSQAQPLEDRPGGEHKNPGPEQGGKERIEHEDATDRDPAQQQPHQDAFGEHQRAALTMALAATTRYLDIVKL